MAGRLQEKVALVTGAGSGMGQACVRAFADEGAAVIGLDIDETALTATCEEMDRRGAKTLGVRGDVAKEEDVRTAVSKGVARFGRIDVLFAGAGVLWKDRDRSVVETDVDNWNSVLAINLTGSFLAAKHTIPVMQAAGGGSIILVGSICALTGSTVPQDAYNSSKGALISLSRSLAIQFAPANIRSNIIHPGMIATPMQREYMKNPDWVRRVESTIPLGRMGEAAEVAHAAVFLASDEASYVTGSELVVDGGFSAW